MNFRSTFLGFVEERKYILSDALPIILYTLRFYSGQHICHQFRQQLGVFAHIFNKLFVRNL